MAILSVFAERFLGGGEFLYDFWDTNPPLSIFIYIPPVLLTWLSGIPVYYTVHIFTITLLIIAVILLHFQLRYISHLEKDVKDIIIVGFLITNCILCFNELGQRDQYIIFGLLPFIVMQINFSFQNKIPHTLAYSTGFFGAILILLKPHHGLIPTLFILYRVIKHKNIKSAFMPDFWALTISTAVYLVYMYVFIPQYFSVMLPTTFDFYVRHFATNIIIYLFLFGYGLALMLATIFTFKHDQDHRRNVAFFVLITLASFISFAALGRGFYYQFLPSLTLFMITGLLYVYYVIPKSIFPDTRKYYITAITVVMSYALIFYSFPVLPTHTSFRNMSLPKTVQEVCPDDCSLLIFTYSHIPTWQLTVYNNVQFASRFPYFWFIEQIAENLNAKPDSNEESKSLTKEKQDYYRKKFLRYVREDFQKYTPDVIMVMDHFRVHNEPINFFEFFSKDPYLQDVFKEYQFVKNYKYVVSDYYRNVSFSIDGEPIEFQIYKRVNDPDKITGEQ